MLSSPTSFRSPSFLAADCASLRAAASSPMPGSSTYVLFAGFSIHTTFLSGREIRMPGFPSVTSRRIFPSFMKNFPEEVRDPRISTKSALNSAARQTAAARKPAKQMVNIRGSTLMEQSSSAAAASCRSARKHHDSVRSGCGDGALLLPERGGGGNAGGAACRKPCGSKRHKRNHHGRYTERGRVLGAHAVKHG